MQSQHVLHKIIDVRRCPEMSSLQWVRCAEFHGGEKHQTFLISRADVARTQNTNTYGSPNLKIKKKKGQTRHRAQQKKTWKRRAKTTTWPHVTSFGRNWLCAEECVGKAPWWGQMRLGSDFQKKISDIRHKDNFHLEKVLEKKREIPLMGLRKSHQSTHPTPPPLSRTPTPATHKHNPSYHQRPGERSVYDISMFVMEGGKLHRIWSDGR